MATCCCSMAGTRACDTCSNSPSNQREVPGFTQPSYYEKTETVEEAINRILKEKGIEGINNI